MILLTGGAGFIGSVLHHALHHAGQTVTVADWLGQSGKWRNLANHPPAAIVPPEALATFLADATDVTAVVHLGAVSDTTASNGDLVWASNVALSQSLWRWCAQMGVPFIYASSAATYGAGGAGFDDDGSPEHLATLRPLNLYGWSKHAFDLWVAKQVADAAPAPPRWAGLKFFNVYGPNEYHKGHMISVIKVKHDETMAGGAPRLFRSIDPGIADGQQQRDFIWVGDVVDVILWLLQTEVPSGLYNVGTGQARTYRDLASAVCLAAGCPDTVEYIDMPAHLVCQYQSYTQASPARLRAAGYNAPFTPLEDGIERYVRNYLMAADMFL